MVVFISYAKEDIKFARRLYDDLRIRTDATIWIDEEKLKPGQNWKREISAAIHSCDFIIVLLSNHSLSKRGYVQKEVRDALEISKTIPPSEIFLIPARLDDCIPQHYELAELHYADLFKDWDCAVNELIDCMGLFGSEAQIMSASPISFSNSEKKDNMINVISKDGIFQVTLIDNYSKYELMVILEVTGNYSELLDNRAVALIDGKGNRLVQGPIINGRLTGVYSKANLNLKNGFRVIPI